MVEFKYKDGRTKQMSRRYADILQKLKHGTYLTRDMRAEEKEEKQDEKPKKATRTKSRKAEDQ